MNESRRNRLVSVGMALLVPLALFLLFQRVGETMSHINTFYLLSAAGLALSILGLRISNAVVTSGLFYGGALTVLANYYLN